MAHFSSPQERYLAELRRLCDAERRLVVELSDVAAGTAHAELREALETYVAQTEDHLRRIERIDDGGFAPRYTPHVAGGPGEPHV